MNGIEALVTSGLYPSPHWLPQSIDQGGHWVRMVRFEEKDFREAPFLDKRGLRDGMIQGMVGWPLLAQQTRRDHRSDAHWIFHISHVGSTLISRLLGECGDTLCFREPLLLLSLFRTDPDEARRRLPIMRRLLSRCFRESQRSIVKATSNVSELAVPLIGPAAEGGKALFISINPQAFIVGRLSRDRGELARRAPERLARLKRRVPQLGWNEAPASKAMLAAMSWASEAISIEAAMESINPQRWQFLDFESFLKNPAAGLAALTRHFDIDSDPAQAAQVTGGPVMRRYSKGTGQVMMSDHRQQEEAETLEREQDAINSALAWLERQRSLSPLIDRACARFPA